MNFDEFEQKLNRQPRREIPAGWRKQILGSCGPMELTAPLSWWRQWLWPHPAAWTALAALWVVVFALAFAGRPEPAIISADSAKPRTDVLQALAERTRLMAELSGDPVELRPSPADRPRSARSVSQVAV
jgi:hypothetical protein